MNKSFLLDFRVTVAICTYNRSHYLKPCLESVLNQSCEMIKIVVYDNGSTDDTPLVVKPFLSDKRVSYVRRDVNGGPVKIFNQAMDECSTDFLVLFHDDDVMSVDMIKEELRLMDLHPECAIVCNSVAMSEKPTFVFRRGEWIRRSLVQGKGCDIVCPSVMFRMERINFGKLRFKPIGPATDWLLWLEINELFDILLFKEPLLFHRIHPGSDYSCSKAFDWIKSYRSIELRFCHLNLVKIRRFWANMVYLDVVACFRLLDVVKIFIKTSPWGWIPDLRLIKMLICKMFLRI